MEDVQATVDECEARAMFPNQTLSMVMPALRVRCVWLLCLAAVLRCCFYSPPAPLVLGGRHLARELQGERLLWCRRPCPAP
jgi:hypothetical protein